MGVTTGFQYQLYITLLERKVRYMHGSQLQGQARGAGRSGSIESNASQPEQDPRISTATKRTEQREQSGVSPRTHTAEMDG